jgi:hypothetical protein
LTGINAAGSDIIKIFELPLMAGATIDTLPVMAERAMM